MPDGRIGEPAGDKTLLRFLTCGSVDDGKSTLIGRLLYNTNVIMGDQLEALRQESRRFGTTGDDIDFSLLLDGLEDERQQRITIDVAYRYFSTARRSFIVADSPGHEQSRRRGAGSCRISAKSNSQFLSLSGFPLTNTRTLKEWPCNLL
jgi:bifunctional enzyme CysN/CysC